MIPALEPMQAAGSIEDVRTRTKKEVVGVAEDDLRVDIVLQFVAMNTFDATVRTDRHKNRREDVTMVRMDNTGTRADSLCSGL